jgi:hypothetical protein
MTYQALSTNVSIVSVSRFAGAPQRGQATLTKASHVASGLPLPSGTRPSGRTTGRSVSGTGTTPQVVQWTMGIGVPQYRCRLMPQSRSRHVVCTPPRPRSSKALATAWTARSWSRPE